MFDEAVVVWRGMFQRVEHVEDGIQIQISKQGSEIEIARCLRG